MNLDNITGKYVICSFGLNNHKFVKVESETKAKFKFKLHPDDFSSEFTQMKNTIIAVGTKEELESDYKYIYDLEYTITKANNDKFEFIRQMRKKNGSWGK